MDQDRSTDGIAEVGVFCGVCHRRNDGASDFCTCRESLIGYRTLNARQVDSWFTDQMRERRAANVATSSHDAETLRSWAGRVDPSSSTADMHPWLPRIIAAFVFFGVALVAVQIALTFVNDEYVDIVGIGSIVIFGLFMAAGLATLTHHGISVLVGREDSAMGFDGSPVIYILWAIGIPVAVILTHLIVYL